MKYLLTFRTIIKTLLRKELPKPLGRWKIESCNNKINSRIDLSNEDHCGPCGEYSLQKKESKKNTTKPDFQIERINK